ncbi:MAG: thiamine phosphate synthase [Acutalibacteraceae bacterium]|nr:thiamine phosphate synthase [Acutalibacteraceae bacterium]
MQNLQNVICITDRHLCHRPFQDQMRIVAALKPKAVILREKDVMEDAYRILLERIQPVCEEFDVPLIVHTYYQVALEKGIHRLQIHLAQLRELPEETRKQFDVIGTTVHSVEEAKEAASLGATYLTASVASGGTHEYGTGNKLLEFLGEVSSAVDIPVYALGGASREQLEDCLASGAAGICMMSRLMTVDGE